MHILYVIEKMSGVGGMERIFADKINWLARQEDIKVTLLLVWKDQQRPVFNLDSRVHIEHIDAQMVKGGLTYPIVVWRYNQLVKRLKPDVTVLSWVIGAMLATFGKHVGKTIFELHHSAATMKHAWLLRTLQRRTDVVVTLTPEDAQFFTQAQQVEVIPNFTTIGCNKQPDYDTKRCVALGRLVPAKDYPRMVRLWKEAIKEHQDWQLDIYGDGPESEHVRQCIEEAQMNDKILLHGNTNDVTKAYSEASIYMMTSHTEGFPMVLLEAMTIGLPVVAFDCPYGPRNIIQNGVNGLLIALNDDKAYVSALTLLMDNAERRRLMGEKAREMAQRFSCETIMQHWMDLFNTLVNDK